MAKYIIGGLIVLCCLAGAWFFLNIATTLEIYHGDPAVGPADIPALGESHGQFGQWYFFTAQNQGVVVGWPGKPKEYDRAVWMLLVRYPKADLQHSYSDKANQNGDQWEIDCTVTIKGLAKGGEWHGHYEVSSQKPVELFKANEKTYAAEKGRVFLLDLTLESPTVVQIPEDTRGLVTKPKTAGDPRPELKEALEKLKTKYPEVKAFTAS